MRKGIKTKTDVVEADQREKNLIHLINYTLITTAIAYAVLKYFMATMGEWGEEEHFLTKYFQAFHILWSALFIFAIGVFFKDHVYKRIVNKVVRLRFSGMALITLFAFMSISGYTIQFLTSPLLRDTAIGIHLITSLLWTLFYIFHHFKS